MKRSAQVALVLMGVTGATAAGAYMMPARSSECRQTPPSQQQTAQRVGPEIGGEVPRARQADNCQRRRSWGTWNWGSSSSYSSYDDDRRRTRSSNRPNNSTSVAFSPSRTSTSSPSTGLTSRSTSTSSSYSSSSSSSTSRGGFGSTGHSYSSGS
jgi:hypothetical protein